MKDEAFICAWGILGFEIPQQPIWMWFLQCKNKTTFSPRIGGKFFMLTMRPFLGGQKKSLWIRPKAQYTADPSSLWVRHLRITLSMDAMDTVVPLKNILKVKISKKMAFFTVTLQNCGVCRQGKGGNLYTGPGSQRGHKNKRRTPRNFLLGSFPPHLTHFLYRTSEPFLHSPQCRGLLLQSIYTGPRNAYMQGCRHPVRSVGVHDHTSNIDVAMSLMLTSQCQNQILF